MTPQVRRWIAAVLAVAATGLTIGLAAASHASVTHVHTIAGITCRCALPCRLPKLRLYIRSVGTEAAIALAIR
jgi:hypothetical protein